jgi:hypothetical protein
MDFKFIPESTPVHFFVPSIILLIVNWKFYKFNLTHYVEFLYSKPLSLLSNADCITEFESQYLSHPVGLAYPRYPSVHEQTIVKYPLSAFLRTKVT